MDPINPYSQPPVALPAHSSRSWAVIVAVVGVGAAIILAILAGWALTKVAHNRSDLNSAKQAAYASGQTDQKKADQASLQAVVESPYRSYTAPADFGSFQILFPKNWNAYATEDDNGNPQVKLLLNPDVVKQASGINANVQYATTVQLIGRQSSDYMTQFRDALKSGKLQSASTTVSGIGSTSLSGQIDDKRTGRLVIVPVRDKVMVFTEVGHLYDNEFNAILAQAKINP